MKAEETLKTLIKKSVVGTCCAEQYRFSFVVTAAATPYVVANVGFTRAQRTKRLKFPVDNLKRGL